MNDIDNQIAEKIIKAVQDASGWQWIKHDFGSNGWMRKGKLMVKAFEHMSPREALKYICFKINDEEWEIPYEMRGKCGGLAIRFLKRLGNWLNIKPSIAF